MTDKLKDQASSLPPAEDGGKKIAIGKAVKGKQVIINPPEKVDINQGGIRERFQRALQKHTVILEKKTEIVLQSKATRADLPEEVIKQVFIRGYKNLPLNTELTREQYAMNRVNSFIAGGAALQEDYDLIPIMERMGMKGTGGAMRPHIKAERNVYNGKMVYHVVNAKGQVKHTASDKWAAKKHLAQKYHSYMNEDVEQINEKDIGKHNNATTGFKPLVKKLTPKYGKVVAGKIAGSIKKKVMAKEEVDQVNESDLQKTLDAYNKGKPAHAQAKIDTRTAAERKAETDKMLAARKKPTPAPSQTKAKTATMGDVHKQIAKSYAQHKPGQYVGDSVELEGELIEAKKSAAVRWQEALQKVKKKREEEQARNAENAKRALAPRDQK